MLSIKLSERGARAVSAFVAAESETSKVAANDPRLVSNFIPLFCKDVSHSDRSGLARAMCVWASQKDLFSTGSPYTKAAKNCAKSFLVSIRGAMTVRNAEARAIGYYYSAIESRLIHSHDVYSRLAVFASIPDEFERMTAVLNEASVSGSVDCGIAYVFAECLHIAITEDPDVARKTIHAIIALMREPQRDENADFHRNVVIGAIQQGIGSPPRDYFLPADGASVALNSIINAFAWALGEGVAYEHI